MRLPLYLAPPRPSLAQVRAKRVRVVRPSLSHGVRRVLPVTGQGNSDFAASVLKPCSSSFKEDAVAGIGRMGLSETGKEEGGATSGVEEGGWAKWPVNGTAGVENAKGQPATVAPESHCDSAVPRMNPLKPGKPVACELGIGTANPDTTRPQGQFAKEYLSRMGCHHAETQAKFERICYHTGIDKRHMVLPWDTAANPLVSPIPLLLPHGHRQAPHGAAMGHHRRQPLPAGVRRALPRHAPGHPAQRTEDVNFAAAACERALAEWGGDRAGMGGRGGAGEEAGGVSGVNGEGGVHLPGGARAGRITHVVVVTVSGVHLPGLDVQLVEALGLRRSTQCLLLQMLGCYAGVTALRIAKDLAEKNADEGARVLLVCSELNSLIFQMLGCYAGVTALRIAKDLAQNNADEGARVLLVCSELNSIIFQVGYDLILHMRLVAPTTIVLTDC
ncbi:unnamed protein product [Closterium sp. Naga37s-1]|nr:unnamed protein product [Closterium sp. Naga37s-1]